MMESYVDLHSDIRWSEAMHKDKIAAVLEAKVPHAREHVLFRRMFSLFVLLALPAGHPLRAKAKPLTPDQEAEVFAAAVAYTEVDELAVQVRLDSARLDKALDYEEAQRALDALPVAVDGETDLHISERAELLAVLAAATPETLTLVVERAARNQPVEE
jgi:hypothetical protein